jgi:hypothetical protein
MLFVTGYLPHWLTAQRVNLQRFEKGYFSLTRIIWLYRNRTIITRSFYFYYPSFEIQKRFLSWIFQERFIIKSWLWWRAYCIRGTNDNAGFLLFTRISANFLICRHHTTSMRMLLPCTPNLPLLHHIFWLNETWLSI